MEDKNIKRMLLGIGFILYSYTFDSGELLALLGILIMVRSYFSKEYDWMIAHFKEDPPSPSEVKSIEDE